MGGILILNLPTGYTYVPRIPGNPLSGVTSDSNGNPTWADKVISRGIKKAVVYGVDPRSLWISVPPE